MSCRYRVLAPATALQLWVSLTALTPCKKSVGQPVCLYTAGSAVSVPHTHEFCFPGWHQQTCFIFSYYQSHDVSECPQVNLLTPLSNPRVKPDSFYCLMHLTRRPVLNSFCFWLEKPVHLMRQWQRPLRICSFELFSTKQPINLQ